jgi:hypothetical protein
LAQPQETGSDVGIVSVEALGGIQEVTGIVHDLRHSKRRADSMSEHSLDRRKNLRRDIIWTICLPKVTMMLLLISQIILFLIPLNPFIFWRVAIPVQFQCLLVS